MNRKLIAIVAVVAIGGIIGALITGFGPAPGGDGGMLGGGESTETATPYENTVIVESTGTDGGDGDTTTQPDPFAFEIRNVTECGNTCREVSATVVNQQDDTATGVTVRSEIYTGGEKIWEGSSDVGDLPPNEPYTDTKTVELSYSEAYKVEQNDGQILIETYIVTDDATYVFKEERDIS